MNNSEQISSDELIILEEKIQNCESQIKLAQKQKNCYERQFLEISRKLTGSILFEKAKSEVSSK